MNPYPNVNNAPYIFHQVHLEHQLQMLKKAITGLNSYVQPSSKSQTRQRFTTHCTSDAIHFHKILLVVMHSSRETKGNMALNEQITVYSICLFFFYTNVINSSTSNTVDIVIGYSVIPLPHFRNLRSYLH